MSHQDQVVSDYAKRGLLLEYVTLAWNVIGTVVVIASAVQAHSIALAGFGLDSMIEIFASVIVVWQLKAINKEKEHVALGVIGYAFFALAAYVLAGSSFTLFTHGHPAPSQGGLWWLGATVIVMLSLAWGKLQTGRRLENQVLLTEARVTLVDAYLALAVLVGVGLNALFGWWWADPLSSLIIVFYGVREGREALRHARSERDC